MRILTFNAAIQDVRILGWSVYRALDFVQERFRALPQALRRIDADIVCLQELFHRRLQALLCHQLSDMYPHATGLVAKGFRFRLGNELLVLSKYPIESGQLVPFRAMTLDERLFTSRGMYQMATALPTIGRCRLINVHASAAGLSGHPESPSAEAIRASQIEQMLEIAEGSEATLLVGDLNAGPEASVANYRMVVEAGYLDAFDRASGRGITWDPNNPWVVAGRDSHLPPQRIDHVFLNKTAAEILMPKTACIVLKDTCVTLPDGRNTPLSDHYGVLVEL